VSSPEYPASSHLPKSVADGGEGPLRQEPSGPGPPLPPGAHLGQAQFKQAHAKGMALGINEALDLAFGEALPA